MVKKRREIFKFDKIKKINNIIIPESDSIKITSFCELLNIDEQKDGKDKNEKSNEIQNDGNDFSDLEEIKELHEEKEDYNIQNNINENREIETDNKYQHNLVEEITDKNIDNLDNF